jgi:hypothetical protein
MHGGTVAQSFHDLDVFVGGVGVSSGECAIGVPNGDCAGLT